jgi:signal transduction histidine kinase
MARLRLRTQLFIATLLIISALTGAILFIVRYTVRAEITKQVQESTAASLRAFQNVQRERELDLSRTVAMLAELPTLKALMTTEDIPTIQDASQTFWKLAGSDLFLLARPDGRILGFNVEKPGWQPQLAEQDLIRSLEHGDEATWWYANGQLYGVFIRPITAGVAAEQRRLGFVCVGYQIDSKVAEQLALVSGSQIALATRDEVIASTLPTGQERELHRWIAKAVPPGPGGQGVSLNGEWYQVASVLIQAGPPAPVTCYVLMSLQPSTGFIQRLNRTILLLGISAVLFAAFLLSFVSRTITYPLDNLVSGVSALAAGDYGYSITPRGSREVAELARAFSKMRNELLAAQQRTLATERIAAFGRAASSISHDLRHYLAAVIANAEFLYEAEKLKLNRDEIFNEIKMASEQMIDLLDSLRELARGERALSPVPAALDQTARRAIDAVKARLEVRDKTIYLATSGEMHGVFDPRKIERMFFNLVLNGCEAASQPQGKVDIILTSVGEYFEIRIKDNGSGVPSAIRKTLFDPFVSSGKANGTGLGLAIVNKIVHDHFGSIKIEESSPAGTVFLIRLPRHTDHPTEVLNVDATKITSGRDEPRTKDE